MRIQDLTGLDVSTAEELQVGNHIILKLYAITLFPYTFSKDASDEIPDTVQALYRYCRIVWDRKSEYAS